MIQKKLMSSAAANQRTFTVAEANARLPLLRSILRDVTDLAAELKRRHEELILLQTSGTQDPEQDKQIQGLAAELDRQQAVMAGYLREAAQLGAEVKDTFIGLVDFPATLDGREVCLCWKLGEPEVAYWHECDAGFAGRRPLHPELPIGKRGFA